MSDPNDIVPTIWSATHGVQGSPFVFVLASDDGVITVDKEANLHAMLDQPSAVLAVECLAQHPSVVLGGTRDGYIRFFDVRERAQPRLSDIRTLRHPSAVTKIKQVADYVIAVAGLNSTLCNYDLRFSKQRALGRAWPNWHWPDAKGPEIEEYEVSNPVLLYPEHRNMAHIELGFDIDVEAGILAAAQRDPYRTVSIFSLKTGNLLKSLHFKDTQAVSSCDKADVKALKFVPDRGREHMKSLWVTKGTRIIRFAW
jgi:WD40 repeat protein